MKIKNYTSSVPVENSIYAIEKLLVEVGATNISKRYDGFGSASEIMFQVTMNGAPLVFQLPANQDKILVKFKKERRGNITDAQLKNLAAQAKRTAWKILYDWVQIQCTMIQLDQVEVVEVFLPYVYDLREGKTLFSKLKEGGFKMLGQ